MLNVLLQSQLDIFDDVEKQIFVSSLQAQWHVALVQGNGSIKDSKGKLHLAPKHWLESILGNNIPVSSVYAWDKVRHRAALHGTETGSVLLWPFYLELACTSCASVGLLRVCWLLTTAQRHARQVMSPNCP